MSVEKTAYADVVPSKPLEHMETIEDTKFSKIAGDHETARYAGTPIDIDEKTNKRLFWKINRRVLFIMLGTYFCQSLDKGTLNFASIMNIKEDANLKGQEVSIYLARIDLPTHSSAGILTSRSTAGSELSCTWVFWQVNSHRTFSCRSFLSPSFLRSST